MRGFKMTHFKIARHSCIIIRISLYRNLYWTINKRKALMGNYEIFPTLVGLNRKKGDVF